MNERIETEVKELIFSYTDELIRKINGDLGKTREEQASALISLLQDARQYFLELEATYYPSVRNKEINARLTLLAKFLSGVIVEKKRIVEELEYQNSMLKHL
jgi:hypothetical protein